ncbi:MAG: hypothetical protein E1N59_464 [Puniceicoccaceae bacterium 5H]|nr:MAG: hypothetical protein E1N59_464 [Puniceicoccaceae bacterium 5H]
MQSGPEQANVTGRACADAYPSPYFRLMNTQTLNVKRKFERRRKWFLILQLLSFTVFLLLFVVDPGDSLLPGVSSSLILSIILGVLLLNPILSLLIWRCPSCGHLLGRSCNLKHCRHCGVRLEE